MSVLDKLVELIRHNPMMSGKSLARQLGYAEARSLYHWCHKAGYKGLRDFREAVLRYEYPPLALPEGRLVLSEPGLEPRFVSYFDDGRPVLAEDTLVWPAVFAYRWNDDSLAPTVRRGDVLLIDAGPLSESDGDLVLLQHRSGDLDVGRRATVHSDTVVVRLNAAELLKPPLPRIVARITGLLRMLP